MKNNLRKFFSGILLLLCVNVMAFAQETKISGIVTDTDGSTLPGVSVIVKGTTTGATTGIDGDYVLAVPQGASVLVFSFVGMKSQEVAIAGKSKINVTLEQETVGLDELVVIGYGTQKKVNVTGSVAVVDSEVLENRASTSTVAALQGTAPGVTISRSSGAPGAEGYSIQIRGLASVNNSSVLVLIDGIQGSLSAIQPEDIESISVLKDAAAAAIYGSKSAGGVILVTTKKGEEGKIKVNYNGSYTINSPARMPERLPMGELAVMQNLSRRNAGIADAWSAEQIEKINDPDLWYEADPNKPNSWKWYGDFDYMDLMLNKTVPQQNHNLSVSGGTSALTYRLSASYYEKDGLLKYGADDNKKYSFRANLSSDINKYVRLETNMSYFKNKTLLPGQKNVEGSYSAMYDIINIRGLYPMFTPNGEPYQIVGGLVSGTKEYDDNRYQINSKLTITDVVPGLKFTAIGGFRQDVNNYFKHVNKIPTHGADGSTIIGWVNRNDNVSRYNKNILKKEFQAMVDYDFSLDKHKFHVLGGYSYEDYRYERWSGSASGLINDNLYSFSWTDVETQRLSDDINTSALQGVFGRFNYNYADKYLVEANVRYDGSSRLAKENRYHLFPSFSAAWRVSNEEWFKVPLVTDFKIRGSWGQLGNGDVLGSYDYIAMLSINKNLILGGEQTQYTAQGTLASADKTWETIETSNIAFDLGLFDNKLTFTGEYFVKRNKDMLAYMAYPSVIGIGVPTANVGELKTWGWEALITWKQKIKDFSYHISVNIDDNQNELVSYYGKDIVKEGINKLIEGMPINSIYGYRADGMFQNQEELDNHVFQSNITGIGDLRYKNLNGDDKINSGNETVEDHGDLEYLGNTSPRYNFGINLGAEYKGFDFSMFFQGVGKRSFYANKSDIMPFYASWFNPTTIHRDYWTEDNRDAYFPRLYEKGYHNYKVSDHWMQDGAYIRLKNIQLGYTLPADLTRKAGIERVRVYCSGQDLWESTNTFDQYDPEMPSNASYRYPFTRGFTMGANITF